MRVRAHWLPVAADELLNIQERAFESEIILRRWGQCELTWLHHHNEKFAYARISTDKGGPDGLAGFESRRGGYVNQHATEFMANARAVEHDSSLDDSEEPSVEPRSFETERRYPKCYRHRRQVGRRWVGRWHLPDRCIVSQV